MEADISRTFVNGTIRDIRLAISALAPAIGHYYHGGCR
jgi:hypothetical protein